MESIEQSVEQTAAAQLEMVLKALNEFGCADLFVVVKAATQALEKATKLIAKAAPKAGSAPKGVQPPQLARPRAWVEFTLQHALAHGWEEFTARKGGEEIEYPAAVEHEGAWIFPESIDEKNPNGKQILMTHAMSLSKQRWSVKEGKGTHKELYEQFLASAPSAASASSSVASSVASSRSASPKAVVRKTAAEKAAELAETKRVKEEEKAAAKAVKDAEKAEAKRLKEAEKEAAKALKEQEKAAAKALKEAAKPVKSPKAAPVKAAVVKALVKAAAPKPVVVKPVVAKPVEWSCPADGGVHPWVSNGIAYLRNSDNQVWLDDGTDELGAWQGVVDATGKIDTSVPEPSFDDEE